MAATIARDPHEQFDLPGLHGSTWTQAKHQLARWLGLAGAALLTPNGLGATDVRQALWRRGIAAQPSGFYASIVDPDEQKESAGPQPCPGLEFNPAGQLRYLRSVFPRFADEYARLPRQRPDDWQRRPRFYLHNDAFRNIDALAYWGIVREHRPQRIVELGSGFSTLLAAEAVAANGRGVVTAIDPFPREFIRRNDLGIDLVTRPAEDCDPEILWSLERDDIVFVDSSHVLRQGGDVAWFFLEVLPRLRAGVLVHVHDVFLPFDYPLHLMKARNVYWTEQYILQAYLVHNSRSEVLFGTQYAVHAFPEDVARAFPDVPALKGASFWIRV